MWIPGGYDTMTGVQPHVVRHPSSLEGTKLDHRVDANPPAPLPPTCRTRQESGGRASIHSWAQAVPSGRGVPDDPRDPGESKKVRFLSDPSSVKNCPVRVVPDTVTDSTFPTSTSAVPVLKRGWVVKDALEGARLLCIAAAQSQRTASLSEV